MGCYGLVEWLQNLDCDSLMLLAAWARFDSMWDSECL